MADLWATEDLPAQAWNAKPPDDDEPNTVTITVPEEYL